ncbi:cysteine proteinase [Ramaria rubella]|nr:cysteine proteinase [Ramaria rubella]
MAATGVSSSGVSVEDLVGGPFAVVESDPGVFTSIIRGLGVEGVEVEEVYSIEPWAIDHLRPRAKGLIFCFPHQKDFHPKSDFCDPTAQNIWFANQLSDDACATQAILNVILNVDDMRIGDTLQSFKEDTMEFDSIMKGLAIANSPILRQVHNYVARPSDFEASLATVAMDVMKVKPRATKKRKIGTEATAQYLDAYHFIGYVPSNGKLWELDGLKKGPLEVGEIGVAGDHWIDVVRPVLRVKMARYGGTDEDPTGNIRFNLLAIVDDAYEMRSDELELLKRQKLALERRMGDGWETKVDPSLKSEVLTTSIVTSPLPGYTFSPGFGARAMDAQKRILDMKDEELPREWNMVVQEGIRAQAAVQEELEKGMQTHTEHQKRTFDYAPFIRQYLTCLKEEGLLNPLLELDKDGKKISKPGKGKAKKK